VLSDGRVYLDVPVAADSPRRFFRAVESP
jgi:hypothetical protein